MVEAHQFDEDVVVRSDDLALAKVIASILVGVVRRTCTGKCKRKKNGHYFGLRTMKKIPVDGVFEVRLQAQCLICRGS